MSLTKQPQEDAVRAARGTALTPVFTDEEIRRLERAHPDGLPAGAVVELLRQRGIDLAEATFRKYVQLGLLPRSRRVGRKGKHRGSHGLYPVACVSRLAEIRLLMDSGLTLEDIQRSAVSQLFELDALRRSAHDVVARLETEAATRGNGSAHAGRRLQSLRTQADALVEALEAATREICPARPSTESAEDPTAVGRAAEAALRARKSSLPVTAGRYPKNHAGRVSGDRRSGAIR
jgi:DNA-binding transcriptional MerR regulator